MKNIKRVGLIGRKIGMSQIFSESGESIPVTLLHIDSNVVLENKTIEKNGYSAAVIGYGQAKQHRVSKSVQGVCKKAGVNPVQHIKEFRISKEDMLEVGRQISINHFIVGQLIDISGVSIGKGFAGAMKRHNFGGLEASHGVSLTHRSHGSTGGRQDPGKVFKNKKMAGHMGNRNITTQNLEIVAIDEELSIIALRGAVPGSKGGFVYINDSIKKMIPLEAHFPALYIEKV